PVRGRDCRGARRRGRVLPGDGAPVCVAAHRVVFRPATWRAASAGPGALPPRFRRGRTPRAPPGRRSRCRRWAWSRRVGRPPGFLLAPSSGAGRGDRILERLVVPSGRRHPRVLPCGGPAALGGEVPPVRGGRRLP